MHRAAFIVIKRATSTQYCNNIITGGLGEKVSVLEIGNLNLLPLNRAVTLEWYWWIVHFTYCLEENCTIDNVLAACSAKTWHRAFETSACIPKYVINVNSCVQNTYQLCSRKLLLCQTKMFCAY
jgi:hypothetical protein